jgi:ABC-type multidrug transport system fused ATPase/permease subunit
MASNEDIQIEEAFAQKRMSAGTFMRLMSYMRPYRKRIVLNLIFTVLATASQLLGPKFIQVGIDRYLTNFTTLQAAMAGYSW